ncbi:hypothetical protein D3C84_1037000 [compost metagenome]
MPPVTRLEHQIDLFSEHQCNAPAQTQATEMRFFLDHIIQRAPDALLQVLQPGVTLCRAIHVFRGRKMQHVQPVGEGFSGIINTVKLVQQLGQDRCGTARTDRAATMMGFGFGQNA